MKGKITAYYSDRGFGFIAMDPPATDIYPEDWPFKPSGRPEPVFFHIKNAHLTAEEVKPGTRVEFECFRTEKGLAANQVHKAD